MAKRTGRQRTHLSPLYFEGLLEKRSFKDKTPRKLWVCLYGNTLFFYNEKRDSDYVEKVDLSGFISIADDSSQDRNLEAARLILQLKDRNIKFTAPNAEARELWKGYIHSVAELSVPSSLNLLPGQIHILKLTVEEEKERIKSLSLPSAIDESPYIAVKSDMPHCYLEKSRLEAELLLERETNKGNMLLRPGSDGNSLAVTTRQDLDGSVFKHYRVNRKHEGGFVIDVDRPVFCATLHEVINYLVEKTDGVLIPFFNEGIYERRISFIQSDQENGEKSVQEAPQEPENSIHLAPLNLVPPSLPPKPGSKNAPREPDKEQTVEDLNDKCVEKKSPKVPLLPPNPAPRKVPTATPSPPSTSPSNSRDTKTRLAQEASGQIPFAALSELKLKLEQKSRTQE